MHFIGRNNIIKLKSRKYHTLRTVPIFNRQIVENIKIDTTNTGKHYRPLSRLGTGTSIKNGWELLTFPEHLRSPPVFSGVRVTRSLVLYVCFVDLCLSFCTLFLLAIVLSVLLRYTILITPLVPSNST